MSERSSRTNLNKVNSSFTQISLKNKNLKPKKCDYHNPADKSRTDFTNLTGAASSSFKRKLKSEWEIKTEFSNNHTIKTEYRDSAIKKLERFAHNIRTSNSS